ATSLLVGDQDDGPGLRCRTATEETDVQRACCAGRQADRFGSDDLNIRWQAARRLFRCWGLETQTRNAVSCAGRYANGNRRRYRSCRMQSIARRIEVNSVNRELILPGGVGLLRVTNRN